MEVKRRAVLRVRRPAGPACAHIRRVHRDEEIAASARRQAVREFHRARPVLVGEDHRPEIRLGVAPLGGGTARAARGNLHVAAQGGRRQVEG